MEEHFMKIHAKDIVTAAVFAALNLCPMLCFAESLDEESVMNVYDRQDRAISKHDINGMSAVYDSILDDGYVKHITIHVVSHSTNPKHPAEPEHTLEKSITKSQFPKQITDYFNRRAVKTYRRDISSITFSPDKKIAYVTSTTRETGSITFLSSSEENPEINYDETTDCTDTLTLKQNIVKLTQSDCKKEAQSRISKNQ